MLQEPRNKKAILVLIIILIIMIAAGLIIYNNTITPSSSHNASNTDSTKSSHPDSIDTLDAILDDTQKHLSLTDTLPKNKKDSLPDDLKKYLDSYGKGKGKGKGKQDDISDLVGDGSGIGTSGNGIGKGNQGQGQGQGINDLDPDMHSISASGLRLEKDRVEVKVIKGRKADHLPQIKTEVEENARVFVDVLINKDGNVTTASIGKGTTTSNNVLTSLSLIKAKEAKFSASEEENSTSTLLFRYINAGE